MHSKVRCVKRRGRRARIRGGGGGFYRSAGRKRRIDRISLGIAFDIFIESNEASGAWRKKKKKKKKKRRKRRKKETVDAALDFPSRHAVH
jgi:hypothetical protein